MQKALSVALFLLLAVGLVSAQSSQRTEPPGDLLLLLQSELDHLEQAELPITLVVNSVSPQDTLDRIKKAAGLTIEVDGELPQNPKLKASFEGKPAKEILAWFAASVDVVYRVKPSGTLVVIARPTTQ